MSDDNEKKEGGKGMTIQQAIKIINPDTGDWELQRIEREGYNGLIGLAAHTHALEDACRIAVDAMVEKVIMEDDGR